MKTRRETGGRERSNFLGETTQKLKVKRITEGLKKTWEERLPWVSNESVKRRVEKGERERDGGGDTVSTPVGEETLSCQLSAGH